MHMNSSNDIVIDLALSEYESFSEKELNERPLEQKRKMYRAESVGMLMKMKGL